MTMWGFEIIMNVFMEILDLSKSSAYLLFPLTLILFILDANFFVLITKRV